MKAILEFELPDDIDAYRAASDGASYRAALQEFDGRLRAMIKHGDYSDDLRTLLEGIRRGLHDCCDDNDVRLQG